MTLQQYLDQQKAELSLTWLSIINAEGLTVCGSGIDEQFELAAILPSWMDTSHNLAKAARLENGMGLICLVPKSGGYLLLMCDFMVREERLFLLIAASKIPKKVNKVLKDICQNIHQLLIS